MNSEQLKALQLMMVQLLRKYARERKMSKAEFKILVLEAFNETIIGLMPPTEKE